MTKKRTVKKKVLEKKVKPYLRFRDVGGGLIAQVKEVPSNNGGTRNRVEIEALLLEILTKIEKGKDIEHSAVLLESLFQVLGAYFKTKAYEEDSPILKQAHEKFSSVSAIFKQEKKLKKNATEQAIGQFVEALHHFGLPRKPAIKAVGQWLPFGGGSSVRTYNQTYRERGGLLAKSPNFEGKFHLSPHMSLFIEWFDKYKRLPTSHPASATAFQAVREIVRLEQADKEKWRDIANLYKKPRPT